MFSLLKKFDCAPLSRYNNRFQSCEAKGSSHILNTHSVALKQKIFFYKKRKRRNLEKKKIGLSCCVPLVKGRKIYIDTTHNPVK